MDLSIIIPCFNEGKIIFNTYQEIKKVLEETDSSSEIIFADDGSTDNTLSVLKSIKDDNVRIINHFPNKGLGWTLRELYREAKGKIVIQMDADLSMNPSQTIPLFLKEIKSSDLIVGSRYKGIKADYPLYRLIPSRIFNLLNRFLFKIRLLDTQSGFYVYKREVLKEIPLLSNGFEISLELLVKAGRKGFSIKEVPIRFVHRTETGQISVLKSAPKMFLGALRLWYSLRR